MIGKIFGTVGGPAFLMADFADDLFSAFRRVDGDSVQHSNNDKTIEHIPYRETLQ